MSKVSDLIFHKKKHYLTSPFGPRSSISTANGNTANFHSGADYGTNGKKLTQYAIEEGKILSCGVANDGAKYVWVSYPRLGVKMLHWHLDSIKVKTGQKVTAKTALGTTGKTGKATGIHLHLGIKRLSGGDYIDPEKWSKNEYKEEEEPFLPKRGYFKKGDKSENIGKISKFMYQYFPAYTNEKAVSNTFGSHLVKSIKEFQKRTGLKVDGKIGETTLTKLVSFGFKY